MVGTLDGVPHTLEFSAAGDEHVCTVRVTMPNGSEKTFEATAPTTQTASLLASLKASFEVKCALSLPESPPSSEQGAPAPAEQEQGAHGSDHSSPLSFEVESRECEPRNDSSSIVGDAHLDQYPSSAEDDDDELRLVRLERRALPAPIAFVPAPETPEKEKAVEPELGDGEVIPVERSAPQQSSSSDSDLQHVAEVPPSRRELRNDSIDLEEGDESEPIVKRPRKKQVVKPRSTPQKKKGSSFSPLRADVKAPPKQPTKRLRPEPALDSKKNVKRRSTQRRRASYPGAASGTAYVSGFQRIGKEGSEDLPKKRSEKTRGAQHHGKAKFANTQRELHNAELPVTRALSRENGRIPRVPNGEATQDAPVLDVTQRTGYGYPPTPICQHPPPQVGPMQHPPPQCPYPRPGPPFVGHHMYSAHQPPPMGYPPQFPAPSVPHHAPQMLPQYQPTPGSYSMPMPTQDIPPGYMPPRPGNPVLHPQMMGHTLGRYPFPGPPLQNRGHAFYQTQPHLVYHAQHVQTKAQREAEMQAAAEKVAVEWATEKAAQDAARNAKSDFEAGLKRKRQEITVKEIPERQAAPAQKKSAPAQEKSAPAQEKSAPTGTIVKPQPGAGKKVGDKVGIPKPGGLRVVTIPSDDEDNNDYVSPLNRLAQKGKTCKNLSRPEFKIVLSEDKRVRGTECTMSVKFVAKQGEEGFVISKTSLAFSHKKGKQLAAKQILEEIEKRMELLPQTSEAEDGGDEKTPRPPAQKKSQVITTAVAAIHRLFSLSAFRSPPDFKPEEPAEGSQQGMWKSVLLLDVTAHGKHTYEEAAGSKKTARQACALKAFNALKEMGVPGIESIGNIKSDDTDTDNEKDDKVTDEEEAEREQEAAEREPIQAIVDMSDDERNDDSALDADIAPSEDKLLLPEDYKLIFPETETECESWFKNNGQGNAEYGLYVDSPPARNLFSSSSSQKNTESGVEETRTEPGFLCISTAKCGMVIRFAETAPAEQKTTPPDNDNVTLPEAVVSVLEDPMIKKYGIGFEEGLCALEHEEEFQGQAINDIAVTSLGITGLDMVKQSSQLASLRELTKYWLKKEVRNVTVKGVWRDHSDMPLALGANDGKEIMIGVLASYASICIREQMRHAARQKRTRLHGLAAEFLQLGEKVMSIAPN